MKTKIKNIESIPAAIHGLGILIPVQCLTKVKSNLKPLSIIGYIDGYKAYIYRITYIPGWWCNNHLEK